MTILTTIWSAILKEATRYTENAIARLQEVWQQRQTALRYSQR
ncbi:MAG TPA: hypothetical protein V6D14_17270 [Coleofasciculaceae cyanobacterium]